MDKKQKAAEKALVIGDMLTKLKQGTFETIPCTGLSPVWKKFLKVRNVITKMLVDYVQCRDCKGLVPYTNQSGTSNLLKHKCKTSKDENFKDLPCEKVATVKKFLMNKIITSAALDFCPAELFCGSGFLQMAQGLVSLGEKYGNIDMKAVHPNVNSINRQIELVKEETRQYLLDIFKKAFDRGWCSASLEICNSNGIVTKPLLATFSIHYFEKDLSALRKNNIFAIGIDPKDDPTAILKNIIRNFNVFGGDEYQLHRTKIITPNTMMSKTIFDRPYHRQDCIIYKIKYILDAGFNSVSSQKDDFNEIINNCRNIVRYIKSKQLKIEVKIDCETWKSKIEMLEALKNQYNELMKFLDDDEETNFILNKKRLKEIVSFVTPFLEAMDDLAATDYPTANKIVLWWALLDNHLQDLENYSFWMKDISKKMKQIFDFELRPTMDNKIDCFLDPRYRWLKMFPQIEREAVYAKVRDMLHNSVEDSSRNFPSCSSSEQSQPPAKKSRFSKFESTEMDYDNDDEVAMYLQAADAKKIDFQEEFNLIGIFWKLAEMKFPKLFQLATTRLHIPASCGNVGRNGYIEQKFTLDKLNDLIIIGSSLNE